MSDWHASNRSGSSGNCVEVRQQNDTVLVRDSKDETGPVLAFSRKAWSDFLYGVRNGEFSGG
jgi:hypothetical protein